MQFSARARAISYQHHFLSIKKKEHLCSLSLHGLVILLVVLGILIRTVLCAVLRAVLTAVVVLVLLLLVLVVLAVLTILVIIVFRHLPYLLLVFCYRYSIRRLPKTYSFRS